MTQSTQSIPAELTPEQIQQIEQNNQLLKSFELYLTDLKESNPGLEPPVEMLFTFFMLGCITVYTLTNQSAMSVAAQVRDLRMLYQTVQVQHQTPPHESDSDETN